MMLAIVNGIKRITCLVPVCLVPACGFQLAGSGTLPAVMQTTYLDSREQYSEFFTSLSDELRQRGLTIVDSSDEAEARLVISEDTSGERVLSVSARNIPREYELYYAVTFSLLADGRALIENEPLLARRNYTFDETEVLGKEREQAILRQALAEDLARQVLRRIEAVAAGGNRTPG
jgi:LPS-assembly lipoprotein